MNIPVTLPIFIHTDETASLNSLGIAVDIAECEVREMVFFNINAISAYTDDRYDFPSPFSVVHVNGSDYICAMSIDKLKQKLGL